MSSNILKADNGVSSGTTGLVYTAGNDGTLQLATTTSGGVATTALTINNTQQVGIGTTSPSYKLDVSTSPSSASYDGTNIKNGANSTVIGCYLTGSSYSFRGIGASQSWLYSNVGNFNMMSDGGAITFSTGTNSGVQAILDTSGNLLVGQTTQTYTSVGFSVLGTGSAAPGTVNSTLAASTNALSSYNLYSTGASAFRFYVDLAGTIHATSTSITAISDASLKTNIKPLETGLAEINRLQPRRFDWLDQDKNEGTNIAGFISQEVQEVLPDLTPNFKYNETETKLGLKMGDMIPTMVKAIQELSAEVTALKAKVGV